MMDIQTLVPVSAGLLYDGMTVPNDIYDARAKLLLIRQGNTLNMSQIGTIRRFNGGSDVIHVSVDTQKMLLEHSLSCTISNQAKLEKETGYAEAKEETMALLQEIEQSSAVSQEALHTVSEELSRQVEEIEPDRIMDLINALAPVDEYLQRHSIDVSLLNGLIGKWLGLPKEEVDLLVLVGLLHDCGKASLPPEVLSAARPLTITEFEVIKMHPINGYKLLSEFPDLVRHGARWHHEKQSGRGYPDGLSGDVISHAARITAVSDIYDAMVSRRAYKGPRNPFYVMARLRELCGAELDPFIVDTFTKNMPKELLGKPVLLSNGEVGAVDAIDYDDLEHPFIRTGSRVVKTDRSLYCASMYHEGGHLYETQLVRPVPHGHKKALSFPV